jgi:hypothetical protein
MPCSAIHASVSGPASSPRRPDLQEPVAAQGAGLDEPPHRLPVPHSEPNSMSPVSACASKWIIETRPAPRCWATPAASGQAMVWSPPSTSGTAPVAVIACTASCRSRTERTASPENISTSPAS